MKKIIYFACIFLAIMIVFSSKAIANVCLLSGEGAASNNCDDGKSATVGLPKHDSKIYSKRGTLRTCDNIHVFADEPQANEYIKTHEYDKTTKNSKDCYVPGCSYDTENKCVIGTGGPCCKSLINNKCWHKCEICRFNMIKGEFYPYADKLMDQCAIVGAGGMGYHSALYDSTNSKKNYRLDSFRNIETSWETSVWTCDKEALKTAMTYCKNISNNTKLINGLNETSTYSGHICVNGRDVVMPTINTDSDVTAFINNFGGCPLSALKCNTHGGYYATAKDCATQSGHVACKLTKTFSSYAEPECWRGVGRCTDLAYSDYQIGNYSAMGSTCSDDNNTKRRYYCYKDGKYFGCDTTSDAVQYTIDGHDEQCGICDCKIGTTHLSSCNNTYYEIVTSYFKAEEKCNNIGYNVKARNVNNNNCEACPYNAMFWKCN